MLSLKNRTGQFIDVHSVSVHYNSHINTVTGNDADMVLAPYQMQDIPVSRFSSTAIDVEALHANMTPDKARRTRFSFGLAVKYSLHNRDSVETIYAVDDFQVQCAIENRLKPGSCVAREEDGPTAPDSPNSADGNSRSGWHAADPPAPNFQPASG